MVFLSCFSSAALLLLSFPRVEWSFLAWFALVPLLCSMDAVKPWRAFRRAWACGALFFFASLGWIIYVTYAGAFLLALFLALYFGLFGAAFVYFQRLGVLPRLFVLSSVWVGLEYVRGHFLSGMGWVMLGHTQYQNFWLIQMADTTGVYGISFLVILVNLLLFETWRARRFLPQATSVVAAILLLALSYGFGITHHKNDYPALKVGVVQPNIPLAVSWDDSQRPQIIQKLIDLTLKLSGQKPDLIVWPETSVPGLITDTPFLVSEIRATAAQLHTPILIGAMANEGDKYFNSAFLIGADGQMLGRYDKIHLVPFGEYLPVRPLLGWIDKFVPIDDFTPGKSYTIFPVTPQKKFGVLICFEDTLGDLCRRFAMAGAGFFVNMTNDAWFEDTREPFLHLQGAVFGCVENHRSIARAANTGVSALVDPWGHVIATVSDGHGKKTFIEGVAAGDLPLNYAKTFYTKYGDIFTWGCFLCILVAVALRK